jgi:hypothetical protein
MPDLGVLSLRLETAGGAAVASELKTLDKQAAVAGVSLDSAAQLLNKLGISAKVVAGNVVVADAQLEQASSITRRLGIEAVVSAGAAQELASAERTAAVSAGELTTQTTKASAALGRGRVNLRTGAVAMTAMAVATLDGTSSITGFATQAGIMGTLMAEMFAPAAWAGYATGVGALVVVLAALAGVLARMRQVPSLDERLKKAFGEERAQELVRQLAEVKTVELLRKETTEMEKQRDQQKKLVDSLSTYNKILGLIAKTGILGTGALVQTRTAAAAKKDLDNLSATSSAYERQLAKSVVKEDEEVGQALVARRVATAQSSLAIDAAYNAEEQVLNQRMLDEQSQSIDDFYSTKIRLADEATQATVKALREEADARSKPPPGTFETTAERIAREMEVARIEAEIQTTQIEGSTKVLGLIGERTRAEQDLQQKIDAFTARGLAADGNAHLARLRQIDEEAAARRRLPLAAGETLASREESIGRITHQLHLQDDLLSAQEAIALRQKALDDDRLVVQNDLAAGRITETQAASQIAEKERAAAQELLPMVQHALEFAAALGDQGAAGALEQIRLGLGKIGRVDLTATFDPLAENLKAALDSLAEQIRTGVLTEEAGRRLAEQAKFGSGIAKGINSSLEKGLTAGLTGGKGFQSFGKELEAQAGEIIVRQALIWGPVAELMATIQEFLIANPWAAVAAAAAMLVIGHALGGAAQSPTYAGGGFSSVGPTQTPAIHRFISDPNAELKNRANGLATGGNAVVGTSPLAGVTLLSINSPMGARLAREALLTTDRRGIR